MDMPRLAEVEVLPTPPCATRTGLPSPGSGHSIVWSSSLHVVAFGGRLGHAACWCFVREKCELHVVARKVIGRHAARVPLRAASFALEERKKVYAPLIQKAWVEETVPHVARTSFALAWRVVWPLLRLWNSALPCTYIPAAVLQSVPCSPHPTRCGVNKSQAAPSCPSPYACLPMTHLARHNDDDACLAHLRCNRRLFIV
jgi:hypothetical protein